METSAFGEMVHVPSPYLYKTIKTSLHGYKSQLPKSHTWIPLQPTSFLQY